VSVLEAKPTPHESRQDGLRNPLFKHPLRDEKFVACPAEVPGAIQEISAKLLDSARCKYGLLEPEMSEVVVHISTTKFVSGIQVSGKLSWNLNNQPHGNRISDMLTRLGREKAQYGFVVGKESDSDPQN
jgi:hypothetical protein